MIGRSGDEVEAVTPEQIAAWSKVAVPATRVAFDVGGEGLLVVGRSALAIRDDTVVTLNYEQLAIAAGAFLSRIVAPGIQAARSLDVAALIEVHRREHHLRLGEVDSRD